MRQMSSLLLYPRNTQNVQDLNKKNPPEGGLWIESEINVKIFQEGFEQRQTVSIKFIISLSFLVGHTTAIGAISIRYYNRCNGFRWYFLNIVFSVNSLLKYSYQLNRNHYTLTSRKVKPHVAWKQHRKLLILKGYIVVIIVRPDIQIIVLWF
jgi:hypothetical protein